MSAPRSPTRASGLPASPTASTSADPTSPLRELDSYTTVDLRSGLLRDHWSLELYGKNVGDEDGITDFESPGTFPNGAAGLAVIRPRTFGMSLGLRF